MKKELFAILEDDNRYIASSSARVKTEIYAPLKSLSVTREKAMKVGFYGTGFIGLLSFNEFSKAHGKGSAEEIRANWDKVVSAFDDKYRIVSTDRELYFAPAMVSLPQREWEKFFTNTNNYIVM